MYTHLRYKQGAISFMAMNLHPKRQAEITFSESLQGFGVEEYLFTPEKSKTSRFVEKPDYISSIEYFRSRAIGLNASRDSRDIHIHSDIPQLKLGNI